MKAVAVILALILAAPAVIAAPRTDRAIFVGDFDEDHIIPAALQFQELVQNGAKEVVFRVHSFGGSYFLGMDFIAFVEDLKKREDVRTICLVDSRSMSMGLLFLESGACDVRLMTERSVLLTHKTSAGCQGNSNAIRECLGELNAIDEATDRMVSARIGMPLKEYRRRIATGAWTLAASDALKFHFVDGLIDASEVPPNY